MPGAVWTSFSTRICANTKHSPLRCSPSNRGYYPRRDESGFDPNPDGNAYLGTPRKLKPTGETVLSCGLPWDISKKSFFFSRRFHLSTHARGHRVPRGAWRARAGWHTHLLAHGGNRHRVGPQRAKTSVLPNRLECFFIPTGVARPSAFANRASELLRCHAPEKTP